MSRTKTQFGEVYEGDAAKLYAQVVSGANDALVTQSLFTGISYRVDSYPSKDEAEANSNPTEITDDTALTVSSVIFNTLQTGGRAGTMQTLAGTGYNFYTEIAGSNFATAGLWYAVRVWADPTSGSDYLIGEWVLECLGTGRI